MPDVFRSLIQELLESFDARLFPNSGFRFFLSRSLAWRVNESTPNLGTATRTERLRVSLSNRSCGSTFAFKNQGACLSSLGSAAPEQSSTVHESHIGQTGLWTAQRSDVVSSVLRNFSTWEGRRVCVGEGEREGGEVGLCGSGWGWGEKPLSSTPSPLQPLLPPSPSTPLLPFKNLTLQNTQLSSPQPPSLPPPPSKTPPPFSLKKKKHTPPPLLKKKKKTHTSSPPQKKRTPPRPSKKHTHLLKKHPPPPKPPHSLSPDLDDCTTVIADAAQFFEEVSQDGIVKALKWVTSRAKQMGHTWSQFFRANAFEALLLQDVILMPETWTSGHPDKLSLHFSWH